MSRKYIFLLLLGLCISFQWACRKEEVFDTTTAVEFSLDTLRFDTVFTELGSATRLFKIYNPSNNSVRISDIRLEDGEDSFFRLNVDGFAQNIVQDLEINANDSAYVFVEVTIDPDAPLSVSPYIIEDYVLFETNGNSQKVRLEAWGQNANYIPSRFSAGVLSLLSCDLGEVVWDDPKPYVVYGVLFIDSCTLTIPAGQKVYVHGGIARNDNAVFNDGLFIFLERGKLNIQGTSTNPVTIQGDRLEEEFQDVAGQWSGIRFTAGSRGHTVEHAIVKNSIVGFFVDSSADLTIKNSQIYNTSGPGIFANHAAVTAENCLIHSNGTFSCQFSYGGNYSLSYCTLANYQNNNEALRLDNFTCVDELCTQVRVNPMNCTVRNSIIFGSNRDEISVINADPNDPSQMTYSMDHCIVRVDELLETVPDFFTYCDPCENNQDFEVVLFESVEEKDFHLDTLSIAENLAKPIPAIPVDLEFNFRDTDFPDIGCYEYQY